MNQPITGHRRVEVGGASVFPVAGVQFPSAINPERKKIFYFSENNYWPQLPLTSVIPLMTFKFGNS